MKIVILKDQSDDGMTEAEALREISEFLVSRSYHVDVVQMTAEFSEGDIRRTADRLQVQNDTLTKDNAALQGRNDSLQASNDTLTKNNAALQGRNDSLQASNDSLQASNDSLQAHNDTLTKNNAALQADNDSLQASNDSLQASNDSLQASNDSLQASNDSLTRDNAALQADNAALRNDSREDSLTGVLNRRGFDQDSAKFISENALFILISVDINDFKLFNDIYGHAIGDQVLITLAREFRQLIPKSGIIARSGGDEFQLMVSRPNAEFMNHASDFFNGVHSLEYEGLTYTYSLSAGFAAWPEQTTSWEVLTRMADSALYHAKMLSKEKFWKYEPDMDKDLRVSLGFNARGLAENAPGAMIICKADGDGELLFANPLCARLFGYDSLSEFTGAVKYLLPAIDPEDDSLVREYLSNMLEEPDDVLKWEKCISYRILTKSGAPRSIKTVGRMVMNEHFGRVFYAFLFDCDVAK